MFAKMFDKIFDKKEARILMLGLDGAGKTTILYKMKLGEVVQSVPTIGFNVDTIEFKNCKLNVWDVGGQDRIRVLWKHYYSNTEGLIFVVDSSDKDRIDVTRDELHKILAEEEMKDAVVLIFANKQDIAVMDIKEIIERLELQNMRDRKWFCQGTSALSGQGLNEGMNWLVKQLQSKK